MEDVARTTTIEHLRELRRHARTTAQRAGTVTHIAEERLSGGVPNYFVSNCLLLPVGRSARICGQGRLHLSAMHQPKNNTQIGRDVTFYHDCKTASLSIR